MMAFNANDSKWLVVMRILREYICLRCATAGIDDHPTVDLIMEQYISSFVAAITMLRAQLRQLKTGGDIIDPVNTVDDVKPTSFLQMVSTVTPVVTGLNDPQFEAAAQFANALFTRFPFSMEDLRSLQVSLSGALADDFFSLQLRNERLIQWTSTTTYRNDDLEDYIAATTVRHDESQAGSLTTLVSRRAFSGDAATSIQDSSEDSAASVSIDESGEVSNLFSRDGSTVKTEASSTVSDVSVGSTYASLIFHFKTAYSCTRYNAPSGLAPVPAGSHPLWAANPIPDPSADAANGAYMKLQIDGPPPSPFAAHLPTGDCAIFDRAIPHGTSLSTVMDTSGGGVPSDSHGDNLSNLEDAPSLHRCFPFRRRGPPFTRRASRPRRDEYPHGPPPHLEDTLYPATIDSQPQQGCCIIM